MALTDAAVRRTKPTDKPQKLADGAGLYLLVTPAGGKLWRLKYRFGGKEKLLALGAYPAVGLADAREQRDAAKRFLAAGLDPAVERKVRAAAPTDSFEAIAREWHALNRSKWTERHAMDVLGSLEKQVFPSLGALPVRTITPPMVLDTLRAIEMRGANETAGRVRQRVSAVFVYAIGSGRAETDPAAIVQKAMAPRPRKGRQPAITDIKEARVMLRTAEAEPAHPVTKLALRLLALTAVRPGEIRAATWAEFEGLEGAEPLWIIPAPRMKMKRDHLVPLAPAAVEILEALRPLTGRGPYPFPNARHAHRPMSENALGYLLNRAGYHHRHVPHGWRATFSTVMNERFPADRAVIDLMLAHLPRNETEAAYNRAQHLGRRRELAQLWADLLLEGLPPASALLEGRRR